MRVNKQRSTTFFMALALLYFPKTIVATIYYKWTPVYSFEWDVHAIASYRGGIKTNGRLGFAWSYVDREDQDKYQVRVTSDNIDSHVCYTSGVKDRSSSGSGLAQNSMYALQGLGFNQYKLGIFCENSRNRNYCEGTLRVAYMDCGCPKSHPVVISSCRYGSVTSTSGTQCATPNCNPGQYSKNGVCTKCPVGTAKSSKGSEACSPCPKGRFAFGIGSTFCTKCPAGTMQDKTGQTKCLDCPQGTYAAPGSSFCSDCPNKVITANALIDYTGAGSVLGCGNFTTAGYWALAHSGSVGADGTVFSWSMTKFESMSEGVEYTDEFASAFTTVTGLTTRQESSSTRSEGWSAGFGGTEYVPFQVSNSIELSHSESEGADQSFEVSEVATSGISFGVRAEITKSISIECRQSCGPDSERPELHTGFLWNWVEAIVDQDSGEVVHHVKTCITHCGYVFDNPKCPPYKCAEGDRDCMNCLPGAYADPVIDRLASGITLSPTLSPTTSPTVSPTASPTLAKTAFPSAVPSLMPSVSNAPSTSFFPSEIPSISNEPSNGPSIADPTSEPTQKPSFRPTQKPTLPPNECFSGSNFVNVQGKGSIPIAELRVGDYVQASHEKKYSMVYALGHYDPGLVSEFVRIHTSDQVLEISRNHFIFVNDKPVSAQHVGLGDKLGENQFVIKIEHVRNHGLFAPLTMNGKILVSGILASNYVTYLDGFSPVWQVRVQHMGLAPLRLFCTYSIASCQEETYTNGISDNLQPLIGLSNCFSGSSGALLQSSVLVFFSFVFQGASFLVYMIFSRLLLILLIVYGLMHLAWSGKGLSEAK